MTPPSTATTSARGRAGRTSWSRPSTPRWARHPGQQRRHPAGQDVVQHGGVRLDDVIRVHLKGHFAPTHHAAVYWRNKAKSGEEVSGRIINTSSEAGLYGNAGQANYGAAKAGIAGIDVDPGP